MSKRVAKHPRNQVSDLVKNMSTEIDPKKMTSESAFRLVLAINEQAVKDADRILKEMREKPNDMLLQLELRDVMAEDLIPFFCTNYIPVSPRKMMKNIIYQRMKKDKLTEMPECWRDQLAMVDEIERYLCC